MPEIFQKRTTFLAQNDTEILEPKEFHDLQKGKRPQKRQFLRPFLHVFLKHFSVLRGGVSILFLKITYELS